MINGPLAGYRIGVTADRRADEQIRLLTARGAECLHGPVIRTNPVDTVSALGVATEALIENPPELVVLTTGLGVRGWLEAADSLHLGEALREVFEGSALLARGAKANGALATNGFRMATDRPLARYVDIIDTLRSRGVRGTRVAVQLDGAGAGGLCDAIEAEGADVVRVPVYKWSLPEDGDGAERLIAATSAGRVDAVTFTARPAVENFFEIADRIGLHDAVVEAFAGGRVMACCVGPVCATGLTDLGLPPPMVPERFRLGAMVHQISTHFGERAATIELAGTGVRIQGRLAVVEGGTDAWLTERERAVLDVLIERPGAVHSKADLLRSVWHGAESDEHLVEVTIGRLRRRLGPGAEGIETVMRRGYRVSAS
ncbi:MAG: uroporphyrinogen-III synthase [Microthrixaceae bacterium]|nr:uroporphyrinogen-III synthase [Microthrixaceae bacterium]